MQLTHLLFLEKTLTAIPTISPASEPTDAQVAVIMHMIADSSNRFPSNPTKANPMSMILIQIQNVTPIIAPIAAPMMMKFLITDLSH